MKNQILFGCCFEVLVVYDIEDGLGNEQDTQLPQVKMVNIDLIVFSG